MTNFLTQETPAKVMSLVGSALFSLAFLFSVTVTNASFSGVSSEVNLAAYDYFGPTKVVAVIDNLSSGYSKFLDANLFLPAQATYAFVADSASYVAENARYSIAMQTGWGIESQTSQVAGASVSALNSQ